MLSIMKILHATRTVPALLPLYVERFQCIGAACGDTCCSGWAVTIDKKTFKAYRQLRHPQLDGLLGNAMTLKPAGMGAAYASMALDSTTKSCPMAHEGLCSVQKNLNESYLSHTCFSYPRYTRSFGGQHEQALSLSCPEAARLALLAHDAFDFVEAPVKVRTETVMPVPATAGLSVDVMNEVRILCMKLIRTEGLAMWHKLALLGLFCENLAEIVRTGQHAAIPALLDNTVAIIEQGQVAAALADMRANHATQTLVFAAFWDGPDFEANAKHISSHPQAETVAAIRRGLGVRGDGAAVPPEQLIQAYVRGINRLPEALSAAPHLLEHFLLNEMYRELFPFQGKDPYQAYLQLIAQYGLLRLMLAAQCNTDGPLPDARAMVQTVHVFYRLFQHDQRFGQMHQALMNSGFGTLDKVYGFLRS